MVLLKILAVLVLGTAVVGGGTYLVMNNTASVETGEEANVEETQGDAFTSGSNTLRGLLGLGQDVMCTFSSNIEGAGTSEGVVYVSNGRMRGDFDIEQSGMAFDSHVIVEDDEMYSWTVSSMGTFAYQFAMNEVEAEHPDAAVSSEVSVSGTGQNAVSLDQQVNYDCTPWNVDESKFTVPAEIDFKTYEEIVSPAVDASVNANVGAGVNGTASQCGACEQIPNADAKAQCLAALSCN